MSSDDSERIKALEKEVKELRRANDILKTASAFFAQAGLEDQEATELVRFFKP